MTEEQIGLVKKSWSYFREIDPRLVGDVFYGKLILDTPEVKHLFYNPKPDQSRKLVDMLTVIVGRLQTKEELDEEIKYLAARYARYGIKPFHFKAVCAALIWTIQQGLGKDWNDEIREAWTSCFQVVSDSIIHASG